MNRLIRTEQVLTATGQGAGAWDPAPDPAQGGGDGLIRTRTFFDGNDLILAHVDDNGFRTSYTYDNLNRRVTETRGACTLPALAGNRCDPPTTIRFDYDPDHNLVRQTDEMGNVFDRKHDVLNRLTQVDITRAPGVGGVTQQRFEYDGLGRTTLAFDNHARAVTTFAYDSLSRVLDESTEWIGDANPEPPTRRSTLSAWRAGNLRSGLRHPGGTTLRYEFDPLDRMTRIEDADGLVATYDYLGGRLAGEAFPNGVRTAVRYDGARRPVEVETRDGAAGLVVGLGYDWDRERNRLRETKAHDPANSETYRYDSAQRLVRFHRPQPAAAPVLHATWKLDGSGNWQEVDGVARGVTSFNEIASITPSSGASIALTSDPNGNLTGDPTAPAGPATYAFDAFNRLISAGSDGGPTVTYTHDAFGRRLSETAGEGHHLVFLYDGANIIEEWDRPGDIVGTGGSPGRLRELVYGAASGNDGNSSVGWPAGRLARLETSAGARYFYHHNPLGSVVALTAAGGDGVERIRYEAYGTAVVTGTGPAAPTANPYLFAGHRQDDFDGHYAIGSRSYDAQLGRFLNRGVLGVGGWWGHCNAYVYGDGNPVNRSTWGSDYQIGVITTEADEGYRGRNPGELSGGPRLLPAESNASVGTGWRDGKFTFGTGFGAALGLGFGAGGARGFREGSLPVIFSFAAVYGDGDGVDSGPLGVASGRATFLDEYVEGGLEQLRVRRARTGGEGIFYNGHAALGNRVRALYDPGFFPDNSGFAITTCTTPAAPSPLPLPYPVTGSIRDRGRRAGPTDAWWGAFGSSTRLAADYDGDVVYHEFGHYRGVVNPAARRLGVIWQSTIGPHRDGFRALPTSDRMAARSRITHEAGHLLGLDHSPTFPATQ